MDTGGGKDFSTTRFIIYIFCEKHLITTWFAMVILHFLCRIRHISCRLGPKWGQREGQAGWNCCKTEFEPCLDCPLCGYLWFTDPFHHWQLFLRNWPIFGSLLCVLCTSIIDNYVELWRGKNWLFELYMSKITQEVTTIPNSWAKQVREIEWGHWTLDFMTFWFMTWRVEEGNIWRRKKGKIIGGGKYS